MSIQFTTAVQAMLSEHAPHVLQHAKSLYGQGQIRGFRDFDVESIPGVYCTIAGPSFLADKAKGQIIKATQDMLREHAPGILALIRDTYNTGMITGFTIPPGLEVENVYCPLSRPDNTNRVTPNPLPCCPVCFKPWPTQGGKHNCQGPAK